MGAMFYGVGVGPGDPELLTLKAVRLIREADVVAYIANAEGHSLARQIAAEALALEPANPTRQEWPLPITMDRQRDRINHAYDEAAEQYRSVLAAGQSIVFLCEGDPFFFGSFIYLYDRLRDDCECQVVPGISSINAVSAASGRPLARLSDSVALLSGRCDDRQIVAALEQFDSVAILKAGSQRPRLLALLRQTQRVADASYVVQATQEGQRVYHDLEQLPEQETGPYFSMLLVTRAQRDGYC